MNVKVFFTSALKKYTNNFYGVEKYGYIKTMSALLFTPLYLHRLNWIC